MSEYVGPDRDGRPLFIGDRARVVDDPDVHEIMVGVCGTVIGDSSTKREYDQALEWEYFKPTTTVEFDAPVEGLTFGVVGTRWLRKLPASGRWDEVTRTTGWEPDAEKAHLVRPEDVVATRVREAKAFLERRKGKSEVARMYAETFRRRGYKVVMYGRCQACGASGELGSDQFCGDRCRNGGIR